MNKPSPTALPTVESRSPSRRNDPDGEDVIRAALVPSDTSRCRRLRRSERWAAALGAAFIAALFGIAWVIVPAERGYGSHQSLGLPACTSVRLLGIRCPTCGMSTAWANFVRGRWASAVRANVTGSALAAAAVPIALWLGLAAVEGRWRLVKPTPKLMMAAQLALIAAALAEWIIRLGLGSGKP